MSIIQGIISQFEYYKLLGEKTFSQLEDGQLFIKLSPESNSIAIIVQHLHGNMLSRWTDFLNTDGEKEWRQRDEEFEDVIQNRSDMMIKWNEGWSCLFNAMASIQSEDLQKIIFIRNIGLTVEDAISRQLAHYPYHIGQIVFIGKALKDTHWQNLSIAKKSSKAYNDEKFSDQKSVKDYTKDLAKELKDKL